MAPAERLAILEKNLLQLHADITEALAISRIPGDDDRAAHISVLALLASHAFSDELARSLTRYLARPGSMVIYASRAAEYRRRLQEIQVGLLAVGALKRSLDGDRRPPAP